MEAIVLAGGFGTRLRSVVSDVPKPLAPVAGRPFVCWVLDQLSEQHFDRCILSVGYLHEMIVATVGEVHQGMRIEYSVEDKPLGTGGAIYRALEACIADDVFVLNGDSYVDISFSQMLKLHRASFSAVTMCATTVEDASRYGTLLLEGERVIGFREKGVAGRATINAGIYCVSRTLPRECPMAEHFSFENDLLAQRLPVLKPTVHVASGRFIDIGIPEDFERAQSIFGSRGN